MEFMLDTIHLADIERYAEMIELSGVTSNPSIIKKEGKIAFFDHMKEIKQIIGKQASLHVQVTAVDFDGILREAEAIRTKIEGGVYIKVPVNPVGLKAIKRLKEEGANITATAIYSSFQGYLAMAAGADYLAPYFNRMENLNIEPRQVIAEFAEMIDRYEKPSKILAASFKNVGQVNAAFAAGAQAATMGADILDQALAMPSISKAVADFNTDWATVFGEDMPIDEL
ncbi:fructose-6-phosphate aldolase [Listeria ilorinensis]|uniref:fructose-6-phosphate aldolase n=1 Tax=Listeria ilorinensis TaxID=2867439 RepID=UPI001EF5F8F5|nr:fructose-6-phosphate aldolase [Listeria ilorinensis]